MRRLLGAMATCAGLAACDPKVNSGAATCASVEVLHPGVELTGGAGSERLVRAGRLECAGRIRTAPEGRAVVLTDDGVELRVAGGSELVFADGRARVERGRVFVSAWGEGDRAVGVAGDAVIRLADASLEVERGVAGSPATRVIAVRGEASFQQGSRQGQLAQGESLEGDGALTVRPAGVWDDWTGGAASPQGIAHRGALGAASMAAHVSAGEAPAALSQNEHGVTVRVVGDLAVTTVRQRFFNGSESSAPVEYRLRVPPGALIAGFRVERDADWVEAAPGSVSARGDGLPGLVATGDGEAAASLGNLAPGESLRAEVTYAEWLTREGARRAYVYPVGDPVEPQRVGEFVLDVDLTRARARTARAPEGARLEADGHVRLRRSDWRPRGDLVVDLADAAAPPAAAARAWRAEDPGPDGYRHLLVDLSLPTESPRGTDLAIVLDDSAATDPGALEVARAAVDAALHQLGPDDRAALFLGDLGARPAAGAAGRMEPVTDARREAILDAIARARPGGASDLGRMIVDARGALDPARNGAVVYLGDATSTVGSLDPARLVEETARQAPDLRLYALAIGASGHAEVLRSLTADGGLTLRAEDPSEAVAAAHRLVAHALRPCLRDVRVSLGDRVAHALPTRVRAWVAGDPLRFVGELTGRRAPDAVEVEAREGLTARRWRLTLDVRDVNDRGDLARRWASSRIETLALTGSGRSSIAELGARYGVVTEASALVLGASPGAWTSGAITLTESPWPVDTAARTLPRLGVASSLGPRGVERLGVGGGEVAVAVDNGEGWRPHRPGESAGTVTVSALAESLAAAEPTARACVARKRALRPALAGSVTVSATVDAEGRVTEATVASTSLGDGEAEACVARAVRGLALPAPALLGTTPGRVTRTFQFPAVPGNGPAGRRCPPSSRLPRSLRRALWRERVNTRGVSWSIALEVWSDAAARCELRWWEDRVALLEILVDALGDPSQVVALRDALPDAGAVDWLDAAIARRFGASWVWRAHQARRVVVDWDALLTRLAAPGITPAQKVALLRAWLAVAPRDVDLRLRLLAALEEDSHPQEARALGDRLRRDPIADARVRGQVGEFLLRLGDRAEALRCLTEIAEFAPYDPYARARLGDLLLSHGWAPEAYHHYQTLTLLQPGDALALLRVALAALAAGREDEGLRLLRRAAEEAGGEGAGEAARRMLSAEVARVAAARPDDPAVRAWLRASNAAGNDPTAALLVRWTHPDLGVEILARGESETDFSPAGEVPAAIGLRAFAPTSPLDGAHLVVRAPVGLQGGRAAEARVQLLAPGPAGLRLVERVVRFDRAHRAFGFVARGGELTAEPVAEAQVPTPREALE